MFLPSIWRELRQQSLLYNLALTITVHEVTKIFCSLRSRSTSHVRARYWKTNNFNNFSVTERFPFRVIFHISISRWSCSVFFLRIWSMFKKKLAASRRKKRSKKNSKKNSGRFAAKFVQKKIKPRSKKNAASRPICVQKKIKPCSKKNAASRLICVQKNK